MRNRKTLSTAICKQSDVTVLSLILRYLFNIELIDIVPFCPHYCLSGYETHRQRNSSFYHNEAQSFESWKLHYYRQRKTFNIFRYLHLFFDQMMSSWSWKIYFKSEIYYIYTSSKKVPSTFFVLKYEYKYRGKYICEKAS